jgi:signal transduction histidine kinase
VDPAGECGFVHWYLDCVAGAWRSGIKPAGTLLLGFSCVLALELGRIVTLLGFRSFSQAEVLLGPWALVLTTPVILMSIFHRSRDIHNRLFQAERDNQAKSQFLSQMSHELRTPLDIILGNAQVLADKNSNQFVMLKTDADIFAV